MNEKTWQLVQDSLTELRHESVRFNSATDRLMINPESPLIDPFYRLQDMLIDSLSALCGDNVDCIAYFVYDCDFGRTPRSVKANGESRMVSTLDDLRWMIENYC